MLNLNRAARLVAIGAVVWATTLPAQTFDPLFRVANVKGVCQVKKPGATVFEPVVNGKAYPCGTSVRTAKAGQAVILLSTDDAVQMQPFTDVTVLAPDGTDGGRLVRFDAGRLQTALREGLPEKAVVIETPVAVCDSIASRSDIVFSREKDGLHLDVSTGSGGIRIIGPQFAVPRLKAGTSVKVISTEDRSLTRITNTGGDYKFELDNGTDTPVSIDTTTRSTVRIWREHAAVGGKLVVSVFAAGPDGKGRENFAYVVGEPLIASSGLPVTEEHLPTNGVSAASATSAGGATTNAAATKKEKSLF